MPKNPHAVALGRKGGRVRSEAKKASGNLNMAKAREVREINRLSNIYRREAHEMGQVSPFRQSLYIQARIQGKSPEEALAISRNKLHD